MLNKEVFLDALDDQSQDLRQTLCTSITRASTVTDVPLNCPPSSSEEPACKITQIVGSPEIYSKR
jgi:hypothetical protein